MNSNSNNGNNSNSITGPSRSCDCSPHALEADVVALQKEYDFRGYVNGYIGIMEKRMETNIMGYVYRA